MWGLRLSPKMAPMHPQLMTMYADAQAQQAGAAGAAGAAGGAGGASESKAKEEDVVDADFKEVKDK